MLILDGKRVRELRKKQGLSQEALVKASGVCRSIISYIETGKLDEVRMKTLNSLANTLGVSTEDITKEGTDETTS